MDMHNEETRAIYQKLESARNAFKPAVARLLFIAEAPPEDVERFFYYPNVSEKDFLYLAIVKALTNCEKNNYTPSKIRKHKQEILQLLQQDGIYLMDLCPIPLSKGGVAAKLHTPDFLHRLENESCVDKSTTQVILVKANVYDCLHKELEERNYHVQSQRLPFPSSGQQKRFASGMKSILDSLHYTLSEHMEKVKELIR